MRRHGIRCMKVDGVELELGPEPMRANKGAYAPSATLSGINENVSIPKPHIEQDDVETDELTKEQLLYYSVSDQPQ